MLYNTTTRNTLVYWSLVRVNEGPGYPLNPRGLILLNFAWIDAIPGARLGNHRLDLILFHH